LRLLSIDPASVTVSVSQQSVDVVSPSQISRPQIYAALYDAGFEVETESGDNIASASGSSWLNVAIQTRKRQRQHLRTCKECKAKKRPWSLKSLLSPSSRSTVGRSLEPLVEESFHLVSSIPLQSNSYRVSVSIGGMTCAACVNAIMDALKDKPGVSEMDVDLLGKSGSAFVTRQDLGGEIRDMIETIGYECELVAVERVLEEPLDTVDIYRALLSIGGMTCSSCESAISRGLSSLDFVQLVDVNLLGHSGTVTFFARENVAKIKLAVEEMGYDCDIVDLFKLGTQTTASSTRTVVLMVDGMFCE
jgi:P-type Cu+ transporter